MKYGVTESFWELSGTDILIGHNLRHTELMHTVVEGAVKGKTTKKEKYWIT